MTVTDSADRGFLLYDPAEVYVFGPADGPLLTLNATDAAGVQWWCGEPEGWSAPVAVTAMDARSHGDGGYAGTTSFEPRALSFGSSQAGVAVAPDHATALAALGQLRRVCLSRADVLYTAPDVTGRMSLWLRPSGQPKVTWTDDRAFEWAFVMIAEDPLKFDAAEQAIGHDAALPIPPTGALFPLDWPVAWGVGGTDTALVLVNRGDEDAQVLYRLTGPAPTPTVVNDTTGVWFTLNRELDAGDTVEVDTRAATVYLNGVSIFGDLRGGFPMLAPGTNTIRWSAQGGAHDPAARLTVHAASTGK